MGPGRRRVRIVAAATAVACLTPAVAASALDVTTSNRQRVLGGLTEERITIRLDDGRTARGHLLRFREDDALLDLRPRLAQGTTTGLQQMAPMARNELPKGGIAGTNGGYFIQRPSGNPNGLHVQGNHVVGTQASFDGGTPLTRSALGIARTGALVFDRVDVEQRLTLPGGTVAPIRFTNRARHTHGDSILYDRTYGRSFPVAAGTTLVVVEAMRPGSRGTVTSRVVERHAPKSDTSWTLRDGTSAFLFARSAKTTSGANVAPIAAGLRPGDQVSLRTDVRPHGTQASRWASLSGALPAGGTLLRNGQIPSLTEWTSEAFPASHFTARHPRTAAGRRQLSNGSHEALLLTVDGRSTSSVGISARELAQVFQKLGAREAVNLDGGGSTTMTVGGDVRNRPSETGRGVASGLFVYAPLPPRTRDLQRFACPAPVPPAGFVDTIGTTHEKAIDCLSWWGITSGTSTLTFSPNGTLTRGQMASLLANWLDDASRRGSGRALPSTTRHSYRDVPAGHTHGGSIARLSEAGIIKGTSATTFDPGRPVTRAQTASLILGAYRYSSRHTPPAGRDTFIDDNGSAHEPAIDTLSRMGVLAGTGPFRFSPGRSTSRGATASLVMRAADALVERGVVRPPR